MLPVHPKQTLSMQTRDGVRLDADVYYPDGAGSFPVLLMRQPYGRAIASTVVYAHPSWYAAHGYIVVIQDVRGRGTSAGSFYPFAGEIEDGYDSVQWAASLPDSTGAVGMYGFSYQGMTQLYAAIAQPPALKALCPAMLAYDLCTDMASEGGAFYWQVNLAWAMQLEAETARLQGNLEAYRALLQASRPLPLYDPVPTRSHILQTYAPQSFYFDWLDNPDPQSPYWQGFAVAPGLRLVDLPMLHIGGWFDVYLRGNLRLYQAMRRQSRQPQHLVIGPWAHLPWGRKVGAVDFGPAAVSPCDRLQLRWFDQFLKGIDTGLLEAEPVRLFEMGSDRWRQFPNFPEPTLQSLFLQTTGLASISAAEGTLTDTLGDRCPTDVLVHDPWRPVPALGGHATLPAGCFDRSALDCRSDVLTYTTAPLTADLHLAGELGVEVYCTADAPSFDLCAVLSEVRPNGEVYNFTQGYVRVAAAQSTTPLRLALQPTCICLDRHSALRLSLSATCFPAHPVNPGTGSQTSGLLDAQIITITVHSGGDRPSRLLLPIQR